MRRRIRTRKAMLRDLEETINRSKLASGVKAQQIVDNSVNQLLAWQRAGLEYVPITEALRLLGWQHPAEQEVPRLHPDADPMTGCLPVTAPQTRMKPAGSKPAGFMPEGTSGGNFHGTSSHGI